MSLPLILGVCVILVLAGIVKARPGMGLPTLAWAFSPSDAPADPAAIIVVPAILTNVLQFTTGPRRGTVVRRSGCWSVRHCGNLGRAFCWAAAIPSSARRAGRTLLIYGLFGCANCISARPPGRALALPLIGLASGFLTAQRRHGDAGGTLSAIAGTRPEDLVQSLGLPSRCRHSRWRSPCRSTSRRLPIRACSRRWARWFPRSSAWKSAGVCGSPSRRRRSEPLPSSPWPC